MCWLRTESECRPAHTRWSGSPDSSRSLALAWWAECGRWDWRRCRLRCKAVRSPRTTNDCRCPDWPDYNPRWSTGCTGRRPGRSRLWTRSRWCSRSAKAGRSRCSRAGTGGHRICRWSPREWWRSWLKCTAIGDRRNQTSAWRLKWTGFAVWWDFSTKEKESFFG